MTIDPKGIHNIYMEILIKAYAKLNLTLEVVRKRADGYHDLSSVMQQINVFDSVRILPAQSNELRVLCDVPLPIDNTAFRAAKLFMAHTGCGGADIRIKKSIPVQAGMGGGSADAAAVLKGMELLYGKLPTSELFGLAERIGADVPFCLQGGCALCEGKGEIITPLKGLKLDLVIVKGARGISTKMLFSELNMPVRNPGATKHAVTAIETENPKLLYGSISNALQPAAQRHCEEIGDYCERLKQLGALAASMTGSGSAVFGVFDNPESARMASEHFGDCDFVTCAQTL